MYVDALFRALVNVHEYTNKNKAWEDVFLGLIGCECYSPVIIQLGIDKNNPLQLTKRLQVHTRERRLEYKIVAKHYESEPYKNVSYHDYTTIKNLRSTDCFLFALDDESWDSKKLESYLSHFTSKISGEYVVISRISHALIPYFKTKGILLDFFELPELCNYSVAICSNQQQTGFVPMTMTIYNKYKIDVLMDLLTTGKHTSVNVATKKDIERMFAARHATKGMSMNQVLDIVHKTVPTLTIVYKPLYYFENVSAWSHLNDGDEYVMYDITDL